jgi:hypothetical protein
MCFQLLVFLGYPIFESFENLIKNNEKMKTNTSLICLIYVTNRQIVLVQATFLV